MVARWPRLGARFVPVDGEEELPLETGEEPEAVAKKAGPEPGGKARRGLFMCILGLNFFLKQDITEN